MADKKKPPMDASREVAKPNAERGKTGINQTAVVRLSAPDPNEAVPLSISPFMHYSTYLIKSDWIQYRIDFSDYRFRSKPDLGKSNKPRKDPNSPGTNLVNHVHSRRVIAAGKDREAGKDRGKKESSVMGVGASDIAAAFGWYTREEMRVAKEDRKVVAEWLHRSAFSWGGIQPSRDTTDVGPRTSQVPRNLIFGSAECNKVMTRYENAWISLFKREHELRLLYLPPAGNIFLEGWLTSDIRSFDGYTSQRDAPFKVKLTTTQQTEREKYEKLWPWLCYMMHYELDLSKPVPHKPAEPACWILGATPLVYTGFFPFQRRFFTRLEGKVDTMIINELFKRYKDANPPPAANNPAAHVDPEAAHASSVSPAYDAAPHSPIMMMPPPPGNESIGSSSLSPGTDNETEIASPIVWNEVTTLTQINAAPTPQTETALPAASHHMESPSSLRPIAAQHELHRMERQSIGSTRTSNRLKLVTIPSSSTRDQQTRSYPSPIHERDNKRVMNEPVSQDSAGTPMQSDDGQKNSLRSPPAASRPGGSSGSSSVSNYLNRNPSNPPPPPPKSSKDSAEQSQSPSSSSPRVHGHHELWKNMLTSPVSISLDRITLNNPRFVKVNRLGKVKDVSPRRVVSGSNGHAALMKKREARASPARGPNPTAHIPTPREFVVKGDIQIFPGLNIQLFPGLTATLSTIQNPAVVGVSQRVELVGDLSLGKLIPELMKTPLDTISLKNTSFTYRSTFQGGSPPGVRFYTDIMPTGELLQPVYDVLHTVFGKKDPILSFSGFIGYEPAWEKPFKPMGFSLRASLRKLDINLWDVINVTDLGLSLAFTREIDLFQNRNSPGYSMSSTFTGAAGVKIPGSVVPMRVSWYMKKFGKSYVLSLAMQDDEWTDAFAIPNLKLANVQFDVSFSIGDLAKSLTLGIQATLQLKQQMITLSGSYSKSDWSAEGQLQDVTLELLYEIYSDLFQKSLSSVPDNHNIVFTSLRLRIGKGSFVFEGSVKIDKYTSASAVVTLSSLGLEIKGAVENVQLSHSDGPAITINSAAIDVFIGPGGESGRAYRLSLSGTVTVETLQFSVGLYFNSRPGQESEYTLYGTVVHGDLKLSSIVPRIKHTFLDLELTNIALIMSNQREPMTDVLNSFQYKVKEGFQICATVHKFEAVKQLTKPNGDMGLILSAAYSANVLDVCVEWPTIGTISFNRNVKSGPISLDLVISGSPRLSLKAALFIKVAKRANPLELDFILTGNGIQGTGEATMKDMWQDPFDISPDVSIGNLLFGVTIIYEEFFDSGIIEAVSLGGNLAVGKSTVALSVDVSENPDDELIFISLTNINIADIVAFATKVVGEHIPAPKSPDILTIQKFDLYLSTGVTFNKINYPAGMKFDCNIVVFKHHATVSATIDKGIIMNGSVDSFSLGGLTVKGFKDQNPSIAITMTPTIQKIKIDGSITALGITTALSVDIEIEDKPVFSFELQVKFADLLSFTLKAAMIGESSGKTTNELDFLLTAEFQQDLLDHIVKEANGYFKRLHEATINEFQIGSQKLNRKEAVYKMLLSKASVKLTQDKQAWEEKREKENKAFALEKAVVDAKVNGCRDWLKKKHGELDLAIKNAEKVLEHAKQKLAVDVKKAEDDIALAAKLADDKIDGWRRDVTKKEQALAVIGGNWDASIDAAEAAVTSARGAGAKIEYFIKKKNSEIEDAHWYSVPGLKIEMYALELEKDILDSALWLATKTLDVARAAVDDTVFASAHEALTLANEALDLGKRVNDVAAYDLEKVLEEGKDLCTRAVEAADQTLHRVQTSGLAHRAFVAAEKSLELAQEIGDATIATLKATVAALEKSDEFILYTLPGKALDLVNKNIKDLDPERLMVNAELAEELAFEGVAKELIEGLKCLLVVKSVKITGKLSSGLQQGFLKAEIVVVIDKKTYTYNLDFKLGDIEDVVGRGLE